MKVKCRLITITRAEGTFDELVTACVAGDDPWTGANGLLFLWSRTAPTSGGYHKCDFQIEYADGQVYEGRLDLVHSSVEWPDLAKHMLEFVQVHAGRRVPEWVYHEGPGAVAKLEAYLDSLGCREKYADFLDNYEIGVQPRSTAVEMPAGSWLAAQAEA